MTREKCKDCGGTGLQSLDIQDDCRTCHGSGETYPEWDTQEWNHVSTEVKAQVDIYKGYVRLNILDMIHNLDDDAKESLISDGGWWDFITKEIFNEIKMAFTTKSYNSRCYELRQTLLTGDAMPKILTHFLEGLLRDYRREISEHKKYENAYYTIKSSKYCMDDNKLRDFVENARKEQPGLTITQNFDLDRKISKWVESFLKATDILKELEEIRKAECDEKTKEEE
jgi:hypothetical protein